MTSGEDKTNDGQDGPHERDECCRQAGAIGQEDKNKPGNKRIRGQDTLWKIATKTGAMQGRTKTTGQEQRRTREQENKQTGEQENRRTRDRPGNRHEKEEKPRHTHEETTKPKNTHEKKSGPGTTQE